MFSLQYNFLKDKINSTYDNNDMLTIYKTNKTLDTFKKYK